MKNIFLLIMIIACFEVKADCVSSAQSKTNFQVLDSHTIMFKGGFGDNFIIKSYSYFNSSPKITILKDSFCDYQAAALYVDGEVIDLQQVKRF